MFPHRPLVAIAAALSLALPVEGGAQGYPTQTIRFVVPYAAGGFPDTVARIVAQRLQDKVGQSVVIENKPGANGAVAAAAILSAPADGYTFLVTDGSMFSINPKLYSKLPYDPAKDFVPVALVARAPLFLAAHPKFPPNTLAELVAYAKSNPGRVNYGSSGIGSTHQLTMEALKAHYGINLVHVPFKGTGQSVPALVGGQVEVLWSAYPSLAGFVKDGRVKLLANNSAQRSPLAPDVPTVAEQVPGFDFAPIVGVLAPAGTPKAAIDRIAVEVVAVTKMPETGKQFAAAGIEAVGAGADEYAKAISEENARMAKAIEAAGIKPE
ncbi:MAG: tripartite tricarboxylate transporter substrate binding protein [Burkholderiales bacterium]|nr:tripartite tricarboxylate transporter substrate binding protein [Burkholderiales bacterium]